MQYQAAETGELLLPQVVDWAGDDGRLNIFTLRDRNLAAVEDRSLDLEGISTSF